MRARRLLLLPPAVKNVLLNRIIPAATTKRNPVGEVKEGSIPNRITVQSLEPLWTKAALRAGTLQVVSPWHCGSRQSCSMPCSTQPDGDREVMGTGKRARK